MLIGRVIQFSRIHPRGESPLMNTLVIICSYFALAAAAGFVWQGALSLIRKRAARIGAEGAKDFVRLREDPWCRLYITIGMISNLGLLVSACGIKRSVMT